MTNLLGSDRPSHDVIEPDSEISFLDIVNFLQESWKKLAAASIVGATLGLGSWFMFGTYSAEYVLFNNNNNNNNNSYGLDLVSWKMLQKSLPNLAARIIEENKAPENLSSIYYAMSSEQFWQKNVVPIYAISKADVKDLAKISSNLDLASTTIINLTFIASGDSKEQAVKNVMSAAVFLRSGGAYLQLRSLLNSYESQILSAVADLQQKIANTGNEMRYQQERVKNLEELRKRFPSTTSAAAINQRIDVGSNAAGKFLPLTTQIIAANTDIYESQEKIARLQDRLSQFVVAKNFLEQALSLQDQIFDGLTLGNQFLEIEANLRAKLAKDDIGGLQFLNDLRAQLLSIKVRFSKGLEANTAPFSNGKKGVIKSVVSGLVAAFFVMFLVLLGQKLFASIRHKKGVGA